MCLGFLIHDLKFILHHYSLRSPKKRDRREVLLCKTFKIHDPKSEILSLTL